VTAPLKRLLTVFPRIILATPHRILVAGPASAHPRGVWDFVHYFKSWRARVVAYLALLRDDYPPFREGAYPATCNVVYPGMLRNKWSVRLRIFYVIPHIVVLWVIGIASSITAVIAWFAILFTGSYPASLQPLAIGYLRWSLRVESYRLLMRDEYPPFSFEPSRTNVCRDGSGVVRVGKDSPPSLPVQWKNS
jgi:hypothetical protein